MTTLRLKNFNGNIFRMNKNEELIKKIKKGIIKSGFPLEMYFTYTCSTFRVTTVKHS